MSQNPYEAPQPAPMAPQNAAWQYSQLPWYRKSPYVSVLTVLGLCCSPSLLAVCFIVLTGEVYYHQTDAAGQLKKWGFANKIVAFVILGFQLLVIIANVVER